MRIQNLHALQITIAKFIGKGLTSRPSKTDFDNGLPKPKYNLKITKRRIYNKLISHTRMLCHKQKSILSKLTEVANKDDNKGEL